MDFKKNPKESSKQEGRKAAVKQVESEMGGLSLNVSLIKLNVKTPDALKPYIGRLNPKLQQSMVYKRYLQVKIQKR